MTDKGTDAHATSCKFSAADVLVRHDANEASIPIYLVSDKGTPIAEIEDLDAAQKRWLEAARFTSAAKKQALIPAKNGKLAAVAFGLGDGTSGEPCGSSELLVGQLAQTLPPGLYHFEGGKLDAELAATAWGLGAYKFRRYKVANGDAPPRLKVSAKVDYDAVVATVDAVALGRDLVNTPASDLGPDELETAARDLGRRHGATVTSIVGDDLLDQNFPMIHAVGRASNRAPRLIDIRWSGGGSRKGTPKITLIGKGICFDTGGLDIKPSSGMLLMKKDMGGAATVLALGHMIMARKLGVELRILIPAAENSIAGNAFRPSDVLKSRAGISVEVGNTDAEGRLVLADAIALADEEAPDTMLVFATLTGAARVALGPDLPAMFTDDDQLAAELQAAGAKLGDPVWRMPLWRGYDRQLDSEVADMNNVVEAPFAGAVIAALFLKRFVKKAKRFAHFDIYGWRPSQRPLGPRGGEPHAARTVFDVIRRSVATKA